MFSVRHYLAGAAIPAANTPIQLAIGENQTSAAVTLAMLDVGTFDNCELTNLQLNETTFDCTALGAQTVILTATDASGNTSTCATPVLVTDPNNNCPNPLKIITECPAEATVGQEFTVDITTENYDNIIGGTFFICWDETVLQYVRITNQIDASWLFGESLVEEGALILSFLSQDFTSGTTHPDGTVLFRLTFSPKSAGSTRIEYCTTDPRPSSNNPASIIIATNGGTTIDFPNNSENECAPISITEPDNTTDCQNEWIINDTSIQSDTFAAATTITSTGTIQNNTTVVFKAGQSITLQAGFYAQTGSDFTAMIEDCTPAMLQAAATERSQPILTTVLSKPKELQLKAYPNPFNTSTTVDYYLPTASQTQLQLMDFMGKVVQTVQPLQETATGWHQVQLNATDLPTGTYFLVLENEGAIKSRQLILVK